MTRIIGVVNQRAGVGKTATAVNLATALARAGQQTLLVDLDPQCHATRSLGQRPAVRHPMATCEDRCGHAVHDRLRIMPGSINEADLEQVGEGDQRESLAQWLAVSASEFDFCLIDCPASDGDLTQLALAAADQVLLPVPCEYYGMDGVAPTVQLMRKEMNRPKKPLGFAGVLLTMVDMEFEWTASIDQELREFFGDVVFQVTIPRDPHVAASQLVGRAVLDHAPRSHAARAYIELCMEVLQR